jgi:hypothetical protein
MRAARSRLASMVVLCLYQHRLMSTGQLQRLLCPSASSSRYLRRELAGLRADGLVDAVACGSAGEGLWFVTAEGAALAEQSRQVVARPYRMDAARAGGPLKDHMLAVNEVGLAFVAAARARGDTCGPLDWIPEVAHAIDVTRRAGRQVICDALLSYVVENRDAGTRSQLQWFIELDRATMPVARLAAKLGEYTRYYALPAPGARPGTGSAWRRLYPRFPRLLVILAGAEEDTLDRRIADLAVQVAARNFLQDGKVAAGVTTLTRLAGCGPFAPVFVPLGTAVWNPQCTDALLALGKGLK